MAACNNARRRAIRQTIGDPTEIALLEAARELGARYRPMHVTTNGWRSFTSTLESNGWPRSCERGGERWVDAKGAPESILPLLHHNLGRPASTVALDDSTPQGDLRPCRASSPTGALRVLGVATRQLPAGPDLPQRPRNRSSPTSASSAWSRWSTLPARRSPMRSPDATRPESASSSITGDHGLTAEAIARQGRHRRRRIRRSSPAKSSTA